MGSTRFDSNGLTYERVKLFINGETPESISAKNSKHAKLALIENYKIYTELINNDYLPPSNREIMRISNVCHVSSLRVVKTIDAIQRCRKEV